MKRRFLCWLGMHPRRDIMVFSGSPVPYRCTACGRTWIG